MRRSKRVQGFVPDGETAGGVDKEMADGTVTVKVNGEVIRYSKASQPAEAVCARGELGISEILCFGGETTSRMYASVLVGEANRRPRPPPTSADLERAQLRERDVVKTVEAAAVHMEWLPRTDCLIVGAADKRGHLGLLRIDAANADGGLDDDDDDDGVMMLKPHRQYISGLRWAPDAKLWTSSYEGSVRALDVPSGKSLEMYFSEELEFSAFDLHTDGYTGLCASNRGDLVQLDSRSSAPASAQHASIGQRKVNSLHIEPAAGRLFVSSAADGAVCVWDLRKFGKSMRPLHTLEHAKSCQGAYFAPDGSSRVLTTCYDDHLRVWTLAGEKAQKPGVLAIRHNCNTGRWVVPFRAVWARDAAAVCCGSMKREMALYDAVDGRRRVALSSECMTAIPSRITVHPELPLICAATNSGRLHIYK